MPMRAQLDSARSGQRVGVALCVHVVLLVRLLYRYSGFGRCWRTLSSNVFLMSLSLYCILCSSSHFLMSSFLVAVVGALSFCLLWYVALSKIITEFEGIFGKS